MGDASDQGQGLVVNRQRLKHETGNYGYQFYDRPSGQQ
jgi:hypothetical protein